MKIGLDYGHCLSGSDTGAEGNGYKEQDLTRKVGKLVKQKLESLNHTVIELAVDYSNSVNESLNARINKANNNSVDWCVSIHLNCGGGHGTEVFTYGAKEIIEARNILNNICSLGYTNRGIKDGSNLAMVRRPQAKAMLIELCFIDSSSDMNTFNADNMANAIVKGLVGESVSSKSGTWKQDTVGWWYVYSDGTYTKSDWFKVGQDWYYADEKGYCYQNRWLKHKDNWYYFKDNCKMTKNETLTYKFNSNGEWINE
ncbi:N-acetylmuramoyl-L-alanine amidase [Clostridium sp. ZBS4]|uniref:N-acetylmuramoyl-L-alanine amidase n=1 Tax=Clostridium sp. ZBS4 TaxID=2949974 RepID=UPI00207A1CBB|nr:N-acetylmuramoyl-L-alanine amidase [Clostridium sp. ZBS4]